MSMVKPLALVGALLLAGCGGGDGGGGTGGPTAGEITLTLTSPGSDDGAILFRVSGRVTGVRAVSPYTVASAPIAGLPDLTRVVVTGPITSGPIVILEVPDIRIKTSYTAQVEQVASRTTFALLSAVAYGIRVAD